MASQYGANTMEATKAVEVALKDMDPIIREGGGQTLSAAAPSGYVY